MTPTQSGTPGPIRTCVGCRERRPQSAVVRITRSAHGIAVDGASDGRGAWLCRTASGDGVETACLDAAIAKRAFARAWKGAVTSAEMDTIRERLASAMG